MNDARCKIHDARLKRKKNFCFLLSAFCILHSASPLWSQIKNPDTFIEIKSGGDIESLEPGWAFDQTSDEALLNIYETLIFYKKDSTKEFEPLLATKVPSLANGLISQDRRSYTFPLREGVRFHNGDLFTCEDARYSLLRFMVIDRAAGPSFLLLEPIAGVARTRDEAGNYLLNFEETAARITCQGQNLKITLPKPYAPFLSIAAKWSYVVSKKWAMEHGDWDGTAAGWKQFNNTKKESSYFFEHTNGTGPFEVERWDKNLKQIILKRYENYWRSPAKLKRVIIKGVPEFATRKLLVSEGDADLVDETEGRQFEAQIAGINGTSAKDFTFLRSEAFFFVFDIDPVGNTAVFSGKLDGEGIPPDFFKDKDVRKGFAYAFDKQAHITEVLKGKARPLAGCIPGGLLGYNPNQKGYSLDRNKAVEHFKKAWSGAVWEKGFKLAVYHDTSNTMRQIACEILKKNVEALSPKFKIEVRSLQWSTYLAYVRQFKMPVFQLGWTADFADPHNFAFSYLHSQGTYPKRQRLHVAAWDKLVEQANNEVDLKKREALYFKLQALAHEEVPQIYMGQPMSLRVLRHWVKGYYFNPIFAGTYFYPISKSLD